MKVIDNRDCPEDYSINKLVVMVDNKYALYTSAISREILYLSKIYDIIIDDGDIIVCDKEWNKYWL